MNIRQQALINGIKKRVAAEQLAELVTGIDLNFQDDNNLTPLHHAVLANNKLAVEALLKLKAKTSIAGPNGNTALHYAIKEMYDDLAKLLLKTGAKADLANSDGDTAAHLYAKGGPQRGIALLEEYQGIFNACIYIPNHASETPLHCAISSDNMYFFTFYINKLQHRYYGQVNLKHPQLLHGPNEENLAHTAVRRLEHKDWKDNNDRTYIMLHLLACTEPSLFDEKNSGYFSSTPAGLLPKGACKKIEELLKRPYVVYEQAQAQLQLLGTLEITLNGLRDDTTSLRLEIKDLKAQVASMTKTSPDQAEEIKEASASSLKMFS